MAKETKRTRLIFEELKELSTKRIVISREAEYIGLGDGRSPKAFTIGEKFTKLHPHQTTDGKGHKGNVEIIEANVLRNQAIAKCILPNCQEMILLEIEEK